MVKLSKEEKSALISDLVWMAVNNKEILDHPTAQRDVFNISKAIFTDTKLILSCRQIIIAQLRKDEYASLWCQIRQYIVNGDAKCTTSVSVDFHDYNIPTTMKCNHSAELHVDGKCTCTHYKWAQKGTPGSGWTRIDSPCPCSVNSAKVKW